MTRPANFNFAKAVNFAMRNGLWHCEISHCEIFALRIWYCEIGFGIAKLALALRISHCEFGLRALAMLLRSAQCPAATVPLLLHPAACILSSTASHFLHFALVFPLIYGLFDG